MLNHGDIIKQEDECYNGHGWEIVPSSWVGTAVDLESLCPPNRHYVFIRRKTSKSEESTFTAYNSSSPKCPHCGKNIIIAVTSGV